VVGNSKGRGLKSNVRAHGRVEGVTRMRGPLGAIGPSRLGLFALVTVARQASVFTRRLEVHDHGCAERVSPPLKYWIDRVAQDITKADENRYLPSFLIRLPHRLRSKYGLMARRTKGRPWSARPSQSSCDTRRGQHRDFRSFGRSPLVLALRERRHASNGAACKRVRTSVVSP